MKSLEKPRTIFIVGTTAVGKTKLSIQLCKALGGQVINCDSKQLYKNANIMTAKATVQQIQGIPHHMLDILQLNQNCYNRNKYFSEAIKCLQDIKARGKVPVIVGGTNYYLQTLLYDIGIGQNFVEKQKIKQILGQQKLQKQDLQRVEQSKRITKQQIQKMNKQQKYKILKQVDPIMGQKLHQNDQSRVTSFLTRYAQTGIPPSNSYKPYVHKLRDNNNILFWIRNSDKKQLHDLMKNRINKMIQAGGLLQILAVFKYADVHGLLQGLNMGALQSIGYKQFQEVYQHVRDIIHDQKFEQGLKNYQQIHSAINDRFQQIKQRLSNIQSKSIVNNKNIPLLEKCIQILAKNTIDYSKRQITWIRNRLFAFQDNRQNFFVLQLENKDKKLNKTKLVQRFQHQVKERALFILNQIKQDGLGSIKQQLKQFNINKHESIKQWKKYYCEKCNVEANGSLQWNQHLKSKRHTQGMTKKQRMRKIREQKKKITNPKHFQSMEKNKIEDQEQDQEQEVEQRQRQRNSDSESQDNENNYEQKAIKKKQEINCKQKKQENENSFRNQ